MRRRARPSPADEALWERAVRDARPLRPRDEAPLPPTPPAVVLLPRRAGVAPPHSAEPLPAPPLAAREQTRLRRGELRPEARLDLHGLTREAAHHAVDAFIERSWLAGRRWLLVITGKGGAGGAGVLKAELPRWLQVSGQRDRVLALGEAAPRDGGAGAYYLRLRRRTRAFP